MTSWATWERFFTVARGRIADRDGAKSEGGRGHLQLRGRVEDADGDEAAAGEFGQWRFNSEGEGVGGRVLVVAVGVDDGTGALTLGAVVLLEVCKISVTWFFQRPVGETVEVAFVSAQGNAHTAAAHDFDLDILAGGTWGFRFGGQRTLGQRREEGQGAGEEAGGHGGQGSK